VLLLGAALTCGSLSLAADGHCPELSGKTIRWVVPARAGGGYDAYSRLLQPFLESSLEARILIENKAGAGGIVGAMAIRDGEPDGTTLGIINASGLLAVRAIQGSQGPDPLADFSILGQVVSNHMFLFTGRDSGFTDVNGMLAASESRPIVFGVRDLGSASFYAVPVTASLLGLNYVLVSGYVGTPARVLAVMRGEVDVVLGHLDSVRSQVEAGELITLLQLSGPDGISQEIPRLGGPRGLAAARAGFTGRTTPEAEQEAASLSAIVSAGRLVVAPAGLPAPVLECLSSTLGEVLLSEELSLAARRAQLGIDYENAARARQNLQLAAQGVEQFGGLIQAAVENARE